MAKRRWFAWMLALVLTWSLALPAAATETAETLLPSARAYTGQFADLENAWCREEAVTVYEAGLMDGKAATRFDIQSNLTYAQITVIAARLHHLLHGGDGMLEKAGLGEPWYRPAQEYLTEALAGADSTSALYLLDDLQYLDNFADLACDRYDFVWYLSAVLPEEALTPINEIPSLPDTDDADILRLYRAGILNGTDQAGTFDGFGLLNRGQTAAILARVIDPARRISFTVEVPNYTQEILGMDPNTVLLTVDGWPVTAEMYLYILGEAVAELQPDDTTDWTTPDRGGMSLSQKAQANALEELKPLGALMSREEDYPLSSQQEAELEAYLSAWGVPYGYSRSLFRQLLTSDILTENMARRYQLTARELADLLADQGYLYGQYAVIYRNSGAYDSDETAEAAAREVRQKLTDHFNDPEYLEFLIWKYSEDYNTAPDLLPIDVLSQDSFETLTALPVGQVSPVLEEDGFYMVVVKLDPTDNAELLSSASAAAAQLRLSQWAEDAQVILSPAYEALDIAAIAQALVNLDNPSMNP